MVRWERGAWGFLSPRGCSRVWGACFRRVGVASGGGNSWPRGNPEAERGRSNAQARLPIESAHLALLSSAGKGEVVSKEVGEEERGARGGVDRMSDKATSVNVEADPHRRRLGRSQTDFALQAM